MTRKDAVRSEVAAFVFARDQGCVAPRLGGSSFDCWGRDRLEHVKADLRMAKRAEPRPDRLVVLCEGHTEPGMKAGRVWCTARANREAMRDYLRSLYPEGYRCIFPGCVSIDSHSHGGFPGGYTDPDDLNGPPIPFVFTAAPGVRDYNGAMLEETA